MSVCSVVAAIEISSWVEQQLVPNMVTHGSFGKKSGHRVETTKYKVVYKATGDDHSISIVLFINLELTIEHQATQRIVCS